MQNCVYVKRELINETLGSATRQGKKLLEPLKTISKESKLPLNILEDKDVINEAEIHTHEGDLWQCLEGEVTFIFGGELVDPWKKKNADGTEDEREIKANEIRNGTETVLRPGDWLWIPPGQPHQHVCKGVARLAIIKIPKA